MGRHENAELWTDEESWLLLLLVGEHGHKWSVIVKSFRGRTIGSVRNRWMRIEDQHNRGKQFHAPISKQTMQTTSDRELFLLACELGMDTEMGPHLIRMKQ